MRGAAAMLLLSAAACSLSYTDANAKRDGLALADAGTGPVDLRYDDLNPTWVVGESVIDQATNQGGLISLYVVSSGALPAGLSMDPSTGLIFGAPTAVVEALPCVIEGTNSGGSASVSLTFTVHDIPPRFDYPGYPDAGYSLFKDVPITPITPDATRGGAITGCSSAPPIPDGLALSATCEITGTPSAASAGSYTITGTNSGGSSTFVISLLVTVLAPPHLSAVLASATGQPYGSINGGDDLMLSGASFFDSVVTVGGANCPITTESPSSIVCTSPPGAAPVDVTVTNIDLQSSTLSSGYSYTAVSQVSISDDHGCAVLTNGALYCWGLNNFGQLGDNTTINRSAPVMALDAGVTQVSASPGGHTCAVLDDGSVKCWGWNQYGQIGNDTVGPNANWTSGAVSAPTVVASGAVVVSTGVQHTCELDNGGGMKCWGFNGNGSVLADEPANHWIPTVVYSSGVTSIATGLFDTCAAVNGEYVCWGGNGEGQLGNGTNVDWSDGGISGAKPAYLPAAVSTGAVNQGNSDDNCALVPDAGLYCWGANRGDELLNDPLSPQEYPRLSVPDADAIFSEVALGSTHMCGISGGALYCWGQNNYSQLGNGTMEGDTMNIGTPVLDAGVTQVATSGDATCAIWNGDLYCWGLRIGDSTTSDGGTLLEPAGRLFP